jgi:hypothetical protein
MRVPTQAMHYGSGVKLAKPIDLTKGFTFQYEVLLTSGLECGGAYVKLLSETSDLTITALDGDTPYSIMFGPDKCGTTNKVGGCQRNLLRICVVWFLFGRFSSVNHVGPNIKDSA